MPRRKIVQGYMYVPFDTRDERYETFCKIIGRADGPEDLGSLFEVEFSDGHVTEAWGTELNPWYPT